jgi:hypothetical protein
MVMPRVLYFLTMELNDFTQRILVTGIEASIVGDIHVWIKPELRIGVAFCHMDVDWLAGVTFVREEVKTISICPEDDRHSIPLCPTLSLKGRGAINQYTRAFGLM